MFMLGNFLALGLSIGQLGIVSVELVDERFRPTVQRPTDVQIRFCVNFRVRGGGVGPFKITAQFAGNTIEQALEPHADGDYARIYTFAKPLESQARVVISLDPDNSSGASNTDYRRFEAKVSVLHDLSARAISKEESQIYQLYEKFSIREGVPNKQVVAKFPTLRTSSICEILETDRSFNTSAQFDETTIQLDSFGNADVIRLSKIRCSNIRINQEKIRAVSWDAVRADQSQNEFLKDGAKLEVDAPTTRKFIEAELGRDYNKTPPFDCALKLFKAIRRSLRYSITDVYQPSRTLSMGCGQCASGNRLFVSLMRTIGLPARTLGGFYGPKSDGGHEGHRLSEVYFSGIGWIPVDATPSLNPNESSLGFGNIVANNLFVTWDDDAKYECGFGPSAVGTKYKSSVRSELRKN